MAKAKNGNTDKCAFPLCRQQSDFIWLGYGLCSTHFKWKCDNGLKKTYKKLQVSQDKIKANETPCECVSKNKQSKFIIEE